jgi:hypothetical protein
MARATTRERQQRFIKSFDRNPGSTLDDGIGDCLRRYGLSWLTDEQVADIASLTVENARFSQRLRVRNRNALREA